MAGKLNIALWAVSGLIAAAVVHGAAIIYLNADRKSYEKGRAFGRCEVVIVLDRAMRKKDPTWAAPQRLIKKCSSVLAQKEPFEGLALTGDQP